MNKSKRTQLSHFQNFILRTFLDNLSLKKKSRRQFTFLCTPASNYPKFYTTMILGEKMYAKTSVNFSTLKLRQTAVIYKLYTKFTILKNTP